MNTVPGATIAAEEHRLPRQTRVVLAQLRPEWCNHLNSDWKRIDKDVRNDDPACDTRPHNTLHLFNCPANPTPTHPRRFVVKAHESGLILKPGVNAVESAFKQNLCIVTTKITHRKKYSFLA